MADGLWVYGVLDGGAPGISEHGVGPVELIRHADLAAATSRVDLERFGEAALREALEDLDQVARLARAHERVLDAALRDGPVVPFRICTIFESAARVRELLQRERETLAAALARLRGKAEWGVKAFAPAPAAAAERAAPVSSGAAYLARKAAQRDETTYARERLDAAVSSVHERLLASADGAVLSPAQDRRLSGRAEEMVLNAAYLVPDADAPAFASLVAELAASYGVALELTGPWPAYHFSR
jgi:Gas vesicle synthesis protein GvpL/GvpF